MKKTLMVFTITALLGCGSISPIQDVCASEKVQVEYKSAIIRWHYKTINGHAYGRKYNETTQKWVGDWVRL
ncbi:hypothetical protein [Lacticaseibacillus manihotivorans]|uniref:Lipoprotein n=1 Tax=Lacticaseibacillus manihotivorans TaxID=88233 RepID=A0A5P8JPL2_9LACO|nr:hypothetical protein [Lacticaseibacillus manihotivorans]QFQ90639.1 hypothetical protein LM010_03980 [Lacticaseibacillus manihotivorans]